MRQMIRWNKSGEVMVIDAELGLSSVALDYTEQDAPIDDYELDYDLGPDDDYRVISGAAAPRGEK